MEFPLIAVLVGALLLVGVALIVSRPRSRKDVSGLYSQGLDHLLQGDLRAAYKSFERVVSLDTDHIAAYLKLGQVMRHKGAYEAALKLHESLIARPRLSDYERVELYKNLALDVNALDQHDKAVEWARGILKIDRKNTWALLHLIRFYRDLGDWNSAGRQLEQWQKVTRKSDPRLLAFCRFRQGYDRRKSDPPESVRQVYRQAVKIDTGFAPAHYHLGRSYYDQARGKREELRRLEAEGDRHASGRARKDLEAQINKLYAQAVSCWSNFLDQVPGDSYRVIAPVEEALFYLKRYGDMEPFLKQVLDKDPHNMDAVASLANYYVRKGHLDEAEQLLSTVSANETKFPLIGMINLKLSYQRSPETNLMPELDRLVDSLRDHEAPLGDSRPDGDSTMSWLLPDNDPLERLV